MSADWTKGGFQRRVIGYQGFRLDGVSDLLSRCRGASVLDIGCNRGAICHEFAMHGAGLVHGCDNYETGILVANEWHADIRSVEARFEVVDLTGGPAAIEKAFGDDYRATYDIIVFVAIYHKLARVMKREPLLALVDHLARRCGKWFLWCGPDEQMDEIAPTLKRAGLVQVHWSDLSIEPKAIWMRQ